MLPSGNGCPRRRKRQICAVDTMSVPADCRGCGACCFSPAERFVAVTGADWTRLGEAAEHVAHFIGHQAFMLMSGGHCAALEMRCDNTGRADFFCTIYDRRPQICRDLARGSPQCAGERAKESTTLGQTREPNVTSRSPASF
jgi:uncharacterized protein